MTILISIEERQRVAARFWPRVIIKGPEDCWEWTGARIGNSYGAVTIQGKVYRVSRVVWLLTTGMWPVHCICHTCDNPLCVNPLHLFDGTHQENMADMVKKGRNLKSHRKRNREDRERRKKNPKILKKGECHYMAKLTDQQAVEIRLRAIRGESQQELAKEFGISQSLVCNLKSGRKRKYLWDGD